MASAQGAQSERAEERAEAKAPANIRALARKLVADQLVSTKLSKAEVKKEYGPVGPSAESSSPRYPWGLSLSLDDPVLKKLGLTTLPTVGGEITLVACCKVTRAEESESSDSGKRRSVSLQITELAVAGARGRATRAAKSTHTAKRKS